MSKRNTTCQSFVCALRGIWQTIICERNMQIHLACAISAIGLGHFYSLPTSEWIFIILVIGLVLTAEAINTAIECCVDLASPQWQASI